MTYQLIIKREADRALQKLGANDRLRITEKIVQLGANPDDPALDIKRLHGEPFLRMRVGGWRVILDRQEKLKINAITRIRPREGAYK
jgi:mRNA interferase RelE/StbE